MCYSLDPEVYIRSFLIDLHHGNPYLLALLFFSLNLHTSARPAIYEKNILTYFSNVYIEYYILTAYNFMRICKLPRRLVTISIFSKE